MTAQLQSRQAFVVRLVCGETDLQRVHRNVVSLGRLEKEANKQQRCPYADNDYDIAIHRRLTIELSGALTDPLRHLHFIVRAPAPAIG